MTVLVLGASSGIGRALSSALARDNVVITSARDHARLHHTRDVCQERGAAEVIIIQHDLSAEVPFPIESHLLSTVDLIVNAASATSRFRDHQVEPMEVPAYVNCDVAAPIRLISRRMALSTRPLDVIFVSSILAKVRSPNRTLYGDLKSLQEDWLRVYADRCNSHVLIARLGTVIAPDAPEPIWDAVASEIIDAYRSRRTIITLGLTGRMLLGAYAIHPALASFAIKLQRMMRPRGAAAGPPFNRADVKDGGHG